MNIYYFIFEEMIRKINMLYNISFTLLCQFEATTMRELSYNNVKLREREMDDSFFPFFVQPFTWRSHVQRD